MAVNFMFDVKRFRKDTEIAKPDIKALMHKYPPNHLYRLKNTNRRVTIDGYRYDGLVDVSLEVAFNAGLSLGANGYVLRVDPETLEVCQLPREFKNPPGWHWVDSH